MTSLTISRLVSRHQMIDWGETYKRKKQETERFCLHFSSQGLSQPDLFHYASAYHGDERALMYG